MTFTATPWILEHGAKAYADYGMGRSLGTLPIQLAGNIKHGGLIETAFGITLREVIEGYGGGTFSGRPVRAVQVGGPLGAYFPDHLLDTPLDYEAMAAKKGLVGHGGIVVFDDSVDMAKQARFAFEFCACSRKDEKSDVFSGCLTLPDTLPPVASTAAVVSRCSAAPKA